jgi:hypothetical protein
MSNNRKYLIKIKKEVLNPINFVKTFSEEGGGRCLWVTSALDEKECLKALVLADSLSTAMTSFDIALLLGPNVPTQLM